MRSIILSLLLTASLAVADTGDILGLQVRTATGTKPLTITAPTSGQVIKFSGTPATPLSVGTLSTSDITGLQASLDLLAPLASPTFTGTPVVPGYLTTATAGTTYAPLASPTFTGTPVLPNGTVTNAQLAGSIAASKLVGTDITTIGTLTAGAIPTTLLTGTVTNAQLVNGAVANLSGTNTGDNAVNSLYSGLVSNATHTGDATGATALTVVGINGTLMSSLATGLVKNTTASGVPSIAVAGTDYYAPSGTDVAVIDGGTGRSTGTTAYALIATGTTATGAQQTLAAGSTTQLLVGGGGAALPVWTTATGTGSPVRATNPALVTPDLGTPSAGILTSCTGLPYTSLTNLAGGVQTWLGGSSAAITTFLNTPGSSNFAATMSDETGTGSLVFATSPTFVTPALGTPTSGTLTACTGYVISNLSGLGTGVGTALGTNINTTGGFYTSVGSPTWTGAHTINNDALGTTTAARLSLTNTTAATVGAQQVSPAFFQRGNGWKTNATAGSQTVDFLQFVQPIQQGSAPQGTWRLQKSINGAAATDVISIDSASRIQWPVSGSYLPRIESPANYTLALNMAGGEGSDANSAGSLAYKGFQFEFTGPSLSFGLSTIDCIIGRKAAANIRQGAADAAAPVAQTSSVQSVVAGTSNTAGADRTYTGSQGTGTGNGGSLIQQTAPPGSTGTAQNALSNRNYIYGGEKSLTESSATTVCNIAFASSKYLGGTITVTTHADDGADFQAVTDKFTFSAVNKAGTVTAVMQAAPSTSTTAASAGTLTTAWTIVANGASVDIKNNAVSSLTQTTLKVSYQISLNGDGLNTVTP